MRIQAKDLASAIGQTLEAVIESTNCSKILCAFSGNIFVVIGAASGYGDPPLADDSEQYFNHDEYSDSDLLTVFGEAVVGEWKAAREERQAQRLREEKERERKMYEKLKAKFED